MRRHTLLSLSAALLATSLGVDAAHACSISLEPQPAARYPSFPAPSAFPTNGQFTSTGNWRIGSTPLELVKDDVVSAWWGGEVRRPKLQPMMMPTPGGFGTLPPGAKLIPTTGCDAEQCELTVGAGPDVTTPTLVLSSVKTQLVRNPSSGAGASCPDVDSLRLDVELGDDTTPVDRIALGAVFGKTEAEVMAKTTPEIVLGTSAGATADRRVTTIGLGLASNHSRDGKHFRQAGRFCFAVTAIDWAGNGSAFSTPQCLDTTDEKDPSVVWIDSPLGGCSVGGHASPSSWWMLLLLPLLALRPRRRR